MNKNKSRKIKLTQGKYATVDNKDYKYLNKYKWYSMYVPVMNSFYAVRNIKISGNKQKLILMHRVIMKVPKGLEIDHINHNTLDNCKSNLRIATHSQNQMNHIKCKNKSSKYKGVSWNKQNKKWMAYIYLNGKRTYLGLFRKEIDGAYAYDKMAKKLFGRYAYLNLAKCQNVKLPRKV